MLTGRLIFSFVRLETGVPFDLETLGGGKREKSKSDAAIKAAEKAASELQAEQAEKEKKTVGWEYRYRVSKMREAQKHEKPKSKKQEKIVIDASLDPILARLKPEERIVGWAYRFVRSIDAPVMDRCHMCSL